MSFHLIIILISVIFTYWVSFFLRVTLSECHFAQWVSLFWMSFCKVPFRMVSFWLLSFFYEFNTSKCHTPECHSSEYNAAIIQPLIFIRTSVIPPNGVAPMPADHWTKQMCTIYFNSLPNLAWLSFMTFCLTNTLKKCATPFQCAGEYFAQLWNSLAYQKIVFLCF